MLRNTDFRVLVAGLACVLGLLGGPVRANAGGPAIDAAVIAGVDQDTTAVVRLFAGGMYGFGKAAIDAHLAADGFLRLDGSQGIAARSLTILDVGGRYALWNDRFIGPYVTGGASYGFFISKPKERRIKDDPETCATAPDPSSCTYHIDRNISMRLGGGWGFDSGEKTTVGIRLDVTYWLLSVAPGEDQPAGSPIPREIPRPQGSWSVLVGLEFMRWP